MSEKPNCYDCKWRVSIPGDTHSQCKHPPVNANDFFMSAVSVWAGHDTAKSIQVIDAKEKLNIKGDPTGIENGWFLWPANFDPIWLERCDGFESPESKKKGEESDE